MADGDDKEIHLYRPFSRIGAAGGIGFLAGGPIGGLTAIAIQGAVEVVDVIADHVNAERRERATVPLLIAAHETGKTMTDVKDTILSDPEITQLAGVVLTAATRSPLEARLFALGKVLGNVISDRASLDVELLIVDALAVIETPHLKVLAYLDRSYGVQSGYVNVQEVANDLIELDVGLLPLLRALESVGVLQERTREVTPGDAPRLPGSPRAWRDLEVTPVQIREWGVTDFGHEVMRRIREAASSASA